MKPVPPVLDPWTYASPRHWVLLLQQTGLAQTTIAERLGVTRTVVSHWARGYEAVPKGRRAALRAWAEERAHDPQQYPVVCAWAQQVAADATHARGLAARSSARSAPTTPDPGTRPTSRPSSSS